MADDAFPKLLTSLLMAKEIMVPSITKTARELTMLFRSF